MSTVHLYLSCGSAIDLPPYCGYLIVFGFKWKFLTLFSIPRTWISSLAHGSWRHLRDLPSWQWANDRPLDSGKRSGFAASLDMRKSRKGAEEEKKKWEYYFSNIEFEMMTNNSSCLESGGCYLSMVIWLTSNRPRIRIQNTYLPKPHFPQSKHSKTCHRSRKPFFLPFLLGTTWKEIWIYLH